ncbi:hypothetical protein [Halorussus halobius]|uniref:hypothetical protein n=1 Tax=Halorussus halobius TaxID=1710537 RepID=UPI001092C72A|nr:hypothetical protein [Halorussus halobius]
MELTWVAAGSALVVGLGYVSVRAAHRLRPVCWLVLCASLFALATRDLFRPRERGHPASGANEAASESPTDQRRTADGRRTELISWLRRRVADWLG